MSLLEEHETVETTPTRPRGRVLTWSLAALLAVALIAVAGLGYWVYKDHKQTAEEKAAITAATTLVNAWNAHDIAATLAAMTPDGRFVAMQTPYESNAVNPIGSGYAKMFNGLFADNFRFEMTSDPVVTGDGTMVTVASHVTTDAGLDQYGVTTFDLRYSGNQQLVAAVLWQPST